MLLRCWLLPLIPAVWGWWCLILGNKGPFLLPCCSPLLHPQTPSLLVHPFSSPHFFLCSSSHLCQKKEKYIICRKIQTIDIAANFSCDFFSGSHCVTQLLLPIIKQYLLMGGGGGVQCSVLPIRGHLAWKFVSVIYCQACPVHTHTGNDGVSRLTNYRALHIWPPPLPCEWYRISQGVHPDIPPRSSFQLLPFWISCLFISFQRSSLISPLELFCFHCCYMQGSVLCQALLEDQIPYNFTD